MWPLCLEVLQGPAQVVFMQQSQVHGPLRALGDGDQRLMLGRCCGAAGVQAGIRGVTPT